MSDWARSPLTHIPLYPYTITRVSAAVIMVSFHRTVPTSPHRCPGSAHAVADMTLLLLPHEHATFITGLGRASLKLPSVNALLLQNHQGCRTKTLFLPRYPIVHRTLIHHLAPPKTVIVARTANVTQTTSVARAAYQTSNALRVSHQPTNQPTTPCFGSVDKHALTCLRYPL